VQDAQPRSPEREDFPAFGGNPGRRGEPLQEPAGAAQPLTFRSGCDWQSPLRGFGGDRNQRHGQSAAAPVPSLLSPLGGQIGEARRSLCSSALPSRWGAGTAPGSPAVRGGSPAAQRPFERGCTDRSAGGCADRQYLYACSCASLWWSGHRGGIAGVPGTPLGREPTAAGHRAALQAGSVGEGSPWPLPGQTAAAGPSAR